MSLAPKIDFKRAANAREHPNNPSERADGTRKCLGVGCQRLVRHGSEQKMDHRVEKVINLMKERPHHALTLGKLAQAVNLSPTRLHQLFKDETGTAPNKFLRSLRMKQSQKLLETTFLSVKEIMTRVGVSDESHFVRDFKKTYGKTPAQYRSQYLSELNKEGAARQEQSPPTPASVPTRPAPRRSHFPSYGRPSLASRSYPAPPPPLPRERLPLSVRPAHPQQRVLDIPSQKRAQKVLRAASTLVLLRQNLFARLTARIARTMQGGRLSILRGGAGYSSLTSDRANAFMLRQTPTAR